MESYDSNQQDACVTGGLNDNFKAVLEKLMQDQQKSRDRPQVSASQSRPNESENSLENFNYLPTVSRYDCPSPLPLFLPPPPLRVNKIHSPPENVSVSPPRSSESESTLENLNHFPLAPICGTGRPPPSPLLLPPLPSRTNKTQIPLECVPQVSIPRPVRLPPPPPTRSPDTQRTVLEHSNLRPSGPAPLPPQRTNDAHGNSLRSPVPPPRTNDTRKHNPNVLPNECAGIPLVVIPRLAPPPRSNQQQQKRSSRLQRKLSSQSFRKRFPFLFAETEGDEAEQDTPENIATSSNHQHIPDMTNNKERFNEADVDAYLLLEPAMAALDIGLTVEEVKRVIKAKLEQTGSGFDCGADLIESVLKIKDEEETHHISGGIPKQIDEIQIQLSLRSEPALAALKLGLSLKRVKQAIRDKLETTGCDFSSELELIEAALNVPEEEDLPGDNIPPARKKHDDEERLCKICMDAEICVVFIECGHLITCLDCSKSLKICPLCRCPIKSTVRTFLP